MAAVGRIEQAPDGTVRLAVPPTLAPRKPKKRSKKRGSKKGQPNLALRALTPEQVEWAYEKWCAGYRLQEIAAALYVHTSTISAYLKGRKPVRPPLVYDRG